MPIASTRGFALLIGTIALLAACTGADADPGSTDPVEERFSLSFDGNGADYGTVPSTSSYSVGESVPIPSAYDIPSPLEKQNQMTWSWNTQPDGSGESFAAGDIITIESGDMTLYAQWEDPIQLSSITPADGTAFSFSALAINSRYLAVLSDSSFGGYENAGSVAIFELEDDGSWAFHDRITAPTPVSRQNFGRRLQMTDNHLVVGAPGTYVDGETMPGAVFVYDLTSSSPWTSVQELTAPDGHNEDMFGDAISIDGDTLAVGARTMGGQERGVVFVFENTGSNSWSEVQKVVYPWSEPGDQFGFSVAVRDDSLAVGAPYADWHGELAVGEAHVFRYTEGSWELEETYLGDEYSDHFGDSVCLTDTRMVVGAPDSGDSGRVYVYSLGSDGSWESTPSYTTSLNHSTRYRYTRSLGEDLSSFGNSYIVGSKWDGFNGQYSGSVFFYPNSDWTTMVHLFHPDLVYQGYFGMAAAISDTHIVVGAAKTATGERDAYVYRYR